MVDAEATSSVRSFQSSEVYVTQPLKKKIVLQCVHLTTVVSIVTVLSHLNFFFFVRIVSNFKFNTLILKTNTV